jgi:hypothetical protein
MVSSRKARWLSLVWGRLDRSSSTGTCTPATTKNITPTAPFEWCSITNATLTCSGSIPCHLFIALTEPTLFGELKLPGSHHKTIDTQRSMLFDKLTYPIITKTMPTQTAHAQLRWEVKHLPATHCTVLCNLIDTSFIPVVASSMLP